MAGNVVKLRSSKGEDRIAVVLGSFGVKFENITKTETEYFDIYDVALEPGYKFQKVEKLLPDIGMHLKAYCEPRGYPVYREGVYRIEVQKSELATKSFKELYRKREDQYAPITMGVDAEGAPFEIDLHTLPNLLIGGVPGAGKSVLLHSIILSLVAAKAEIYLVDPKMVEFGAYENVGRVKRIVNTVEETYELIEEVREIMEDRFEILHYDGSRNIHEYNMKKQLHKNLAPIIIVIDEWADIVLQDKKIQKPLCILAQKGRAAGVSIVLATQRPSSTVISGLIKANFSGRIALRVASNVDSRVILDQSGAEKIRNIAEGLYLDQSLSEPIMFKATYIKSPQKTLENMEELKAELPFWKRLWL